MAIALISWLKQRKKTLIKQGLSQQQRRWFSQVLPVIAVFILLAVSLYLLDFGMRHPLSGQTINPWLIPLNLVLVGVLSILVIWHLTRALHQLHARRAGARFTLRLLRGFILLTLLPVTIVAFFSMNFLGDRIDSYFDVRIESALEDANELSRKWLEATQQQHLAALLAVANDVKSLKAWKRPYFLEENRQKMKAHELILLSSDRRIQALSVESSERLVPHFPATDLLRALDQNNYLYQLEPVGEENQEALFSRVAVKFKAHIDEKYYYLTALVPMNTYDQLLTESIRQSLQDYQAFDYQRQIIKNSFRLLLLIIMVLTVLFAVWAAFVFSARMTSPVRTLVEGTLAVASGDLEKKLPVSKRDDFSLLARSFNTMTTRLSEAKHESEIRRLQVQRQHDYLNTVMEHITSGVIILDSDGFIRRINSASEQILNVSLASYVGKSFRALCQNSSELTPLIEAIQPLLLSAKKEWQIDITLHSDGAGRKIIVCRGASLPETIPMAGKLGKGYVLAFDEVTDLLQAEHDAAWSEVARRLAHEIKNPLTPIQLSSERLNHKLSPLLDEKSRIFLQRMTTTITNQVGNMKSMVNAFSEYAKAPALSLQKSNLNALLNEVAELYQNNDKKAHIELALGDIPDVMLDHNRIRQLLVNLLKNALEALEGQNNATIRLSTRYHSSQKGNQHDKWITLEVADNGPGIPEQLLPKLFEPYVTNKNKGTGLGLAIVKKIVEEHSGMISAYNRENVESVSGAIIDIQLPVEL